MSVDPTAGLRDFAAGFADWLHAHRRDLAGFERRPFRSVRDYLDRLLPFQRLLFDEGWTRCGWDERFGGLGGDPRLRAVVYDAIYRAGLDLPRGFELLEVVGPTLVEFAPEIAARELPLLMSGRLTVCQGFSEPEAGSDLASLRTRAERTEDGFRVHGQKTWVSLANVADRSLLLARTGERADRHRAITAFWLDLSAPGTTVRPISFVDGRDEFAEIFLDDVPIPADAVVGRLDRGWEVAMYLLQFERGTYAWQRQAWLADLLQGTLRSPSRPDRGTLPLERLADAWLNHVALRSRAARTVSALAVGDRPGSRTSIDKLLMTAAEQSVLDAVRSWTWPETEASPEHPELEDEWFYSRAASVYGGASEIQRDIIAHQILGLPR